MAAITGVFQNIPELDFLDLGATREQSIGNFKELQIGAGYNVIRMDSDGIWIGGETFLSAPFRADMLGNFYWNDGTTDRMYIGTE